MTAPTSAPAQTRKIMVGLGELLWDLLPGGRKMGGAPANFAFHARQLGADASPVSRVGDDDLGREILDRIRRLGLSADHVQIDPEVPTGTVQVALGPGGMPSYTITENVAWDRLAWTPELEALAGRADAVCYGSLAQRAEPSRETIRRFLAATRPAALRIFDINLRGDFYSAEVLAGGLELARVAKMNDEELPIVCRLLGLPFEGERESEPERAGSEGERAACAVLRERFDLELVCLTRGERGSLLVGRADAAETPGVPVRVADTVGAGDAFVAAVAYHLLNGAPLEAVGRAANALGAWVAGQPGATPELTDDARQQALNP